MEQEKDLTKQQNTIRFIEAAQELIDSEELKVSIRKIAEKAGFHNSTIYLYFKDVDELILLASLKHFGGYSTALARQNRQSMTAYENFLSIWKFFSESAFDKPEIFYNFSLENTARILQRSLSGITTCSRTKGMFTAKTSRACILEKTSMNGAI